MVTPLSSNKYLYINAHLPASRKRPLQGLITALLLDALAVDRQGGFTGEGPSDRELPTFVLSCFGLGQAVCVMQYLWVFQLFEEERLGES